MNPTFTNLTTAPPQNELVVVKLWEVYLLYHPANLYRTLIENSFENGPELDRNLPGRVVFKFTQEAWQEVIKPLLYEFRIPVTIKSGALSAIRGKARVTAFV